MLETADTIALVALIVSLVALTVSTLQALQQYFSTAEAYRRCHQRVIGEWASLRHRRFIWTEFRYEVLFAAPHIFYEDVHSVLSSKRNDSGLAATVTNGKLNGINQSDPEKQNAVPIRTQTMAPPGHIQGLLKPKLPSKNEFYKETRHFRSAQQATWLSFLEAIHECTRDGSIQISPTFSDEKGATVLPTTETSFTYTVPAIKITQYSWDYMPSEALRPMATMTISDLAVLARHLGMQWKTFAPEKNAFIAEGNGQMLTGTSILGIGSVISYEKTTDGDICQPNSLRDRYVWNKDAWPMVFGMVRGRFDNVDRAIEGEGAWREVMKTMDLWYKEGYTNMPHCLPALIAPRLSAMGSDVIRVPRPHSMVYDPMYRRGCYLKFHDGLEHYIPWREAQSQRGWPSEKLQSILKWSTDMREQTDLRIFWDKSPSNEDKAWGSLDTAQRKTAIRFFDRVRAELDAADAYLDDLAKKVGGGDDSITAAFHWELVASYVKFLITHDRTQRDTKDRHMSWRDLRVASTRGLFQDLQKRQESPLYKRLRHRIRKLLEGQSEESVSSTELWQQNQKQGESLEEWEVHDALVVLVWRAQLWHRCHFLGNRDVPVGAEYSRSLQKVFIN